MYGKFISVAYAAYEKFVPDQVRKLFSPFVHSRDSLALFVNYILIGITGEAILFVLFWALLGFGVNRVLALGISYTVAVSAQFVLNKYCNFRAFDRTVVQQARTYVVITAIVYAVSIPIIEITVRFLHLGAMVGLLFTVPICLPIGYLGNRYLTFGPGILGRIRERFNHMFSFLRGKLHGMSFGSLIFLEFEGFTQWLIGNLPGAVGFTVRYILYKLMFRGLKGFCWVQPRVTFVHSNRLNVGKNFGCNSGSYINAIGGVSFGDYVLIGSNVTISSGTHPIDGELPPVFARRAIPSPICVEDDVWIGAGAVILPGVTLRKGSVIGANAVVTHDTEEYSVNIGAPARKIRSRHSSQPSA